MGWTPQTFYRSTLRDLFDAAKGKAELEEERLDWMLFIGRKVMWSNVAPWSKDIKEKDFFVIPRMDEEIMKAKIKSMTPIKVTVDGEEQQ